MSLHCYPSQLSSLITSLKYSNCLCTRHENFGGCTINMQIARLGRRAIRYGRMACGPRQTGTSRRQGRARQSREVKRRAATLLRVAWGSLLSVQKFQCVFPRGIYHSYGGSSWRANLCRDDLDTRKKITEKKMQTDGGSLCYVTCYYCISSSLLHKAHFGRGLIRSLLLHSNYLYNFFFSSLSFPSSARPPSSLF